MTWIVWGVLLIIQNAAFTWVSRARNSGSYVYHGVAAVFSNGVWIVQQFILIDVLVRLIREGSMLERIATAVFYIVCTVTGSVLMHWISVRFLESGKRRVGA